MKKYLYFAIILLGGFAGCKKDSLSKLPIETSFSDPTGVLKTYQTTLTTGDGWKVTLIPSKSNIYTGYFKFETTGDYKYVMDYSTAVATTPVADKYTLSVTKSNPTLSFPASSMFANFVLNNPALGIDTAYTLKYTSALGDTVKLLGNVYGASLVLTKATKAESDDYLAGKIAQFMNTVNSLSNFKLYFKRTTINGKDYDLIFNTKRKFITFDFATAGVFQRFSVAYAYTLNGVIFRQNFVDGATSVSGINGISVDLANSKATATIGTTAINITNFATPVSVDLGAPTRFNGPTGYQWLSYTSFTRDGVVDFLNVRSIVGFSFIVHWIKYSSPYDWAGFTFGNTVNFGPALTSSVNATTGIIKYTFPGSFGTVPAANAATNTAMATTYADTQGYYVVQTGTLMYDLVSVKDGRTWISYE